MYKRNYFIVKVFVAFVIYKGREGKLTLLLFIIDCRYDNFLQGISNDGYFLMWKNKHGFWHFGIGSYKMEVDAFIKLLICGNINRICIKNFSQRLH